jgi:hypothetical protein
MGILHTWELIDKDVMVMFYYIDNNALSPVFVCNLTLSEVS